MLVLLIFVYLAYFFNSYSHPLDSFSDFSTSTDFLQASAFMSPTKQS